MLVVLAGVSLAGAMTAPGTQGLGVRFVEWVRSHGGGPFVLWAEREWYSHNPPPVGGRPAAALLRPFGGSGTTSASGASGSHPSSNTTPSSSPSTTQPSRAVTVAEPPHLPAPSNIPQLPGVDIPGEGVWHAAGPTVGGVSSMYVAYVAPDAIHTSLVTGVVWMDQKMLAARLFAGWQEPPGGLPWQYHSPLGGTTATGLVAAYNAGFRMSAAEGGWYSEGKTAVPLRNGAASFVIYENGSANVGTWGQDVSMTPNVVSVRQNLSLIVDNGQPAPGLSNNSFLLWGATLGGQLYVWRSAVGITANGALLYAGGPGLSITDLADVMVRAGAVRAMEMDINTDWVNFFAFSPAKGQLAAPINAVKLLADMIQPTSRYFAADPRDFIGEYLRPGLPGTLSNGLLATDQSWAVHASKG